MPELPEVEVVVRGLSQRLIGKTIDNIEVLTPKSFRFTDGLVASDIIGSTVQDVLRKGKHIIIHTTNPNNDIIYLVVHLKMTGQLVLRDKSDHFGAGHPNSSLVGALPDQSTRAIFTLDEGAVLYFNDQRKFGWINATNNLKHIDSLNLLGPDLLTDEISNKIFVQRLKKYPRSRIKPKLLDQSVIAGIGNIYADESLHASNIHPEELIGRITDQQLSELYTQVVRVMQLSIKSGGSTDKNYVDSAGRKGSYLNFAKVFRRENQPCLDCGTTIAKMKVASRGTHYCPNCQKLGAR